LLHRLIESYNIKKAMRSVYFGLAMLTEALDVWIAGEARWTEALDSIGTRVAMRVLSA